MKIDLNGKTAVVIGSTAGIGTASLGLGKLSGPVVGGLLADWFGPSAICWFAAAMHGAGTLAAAADGSFGQK